jgi:hypothetical protein
MPWSFLAGYDGRLRDVRTAAAIIESRWVQARQVLHVHIILIADKFHEFVRQLQREMTGQVEGFGVRARIVNRDYEQIRHLQELHRVRRQSRYAGRQTQRLGIIRRFAGFS